VNRGALLVSQLMQRRAALYGVSWKYASSVGFDGTDSCSVSSKGATVAHAPPHEVQFAWSEAAQV